MDDRGPFFIFALRTFWQVKASLSHSFLFLQRRDDLPSCRRHSSNPWSGCGDWEKVSVGCGSPEGRVTLAGSFWTSLGKQLQSNKVDML